MGRERSRQAWLEPLSTEERSEDVRGDLGCRFLQTGRKQSGAGGVYVEALAKTCTESGSGLVLRENPPERLLIAPLYFGGAIRIVVFGASVSFGFCGLMLF